MVAIPVPEPDLVPETLAERARALIPAVRDQQDEAERLGHHTAELDRTFTGNATVAGTSGRIYGIYHAGPVIPVIGAARAALGEYEQIIKTRLTLFQPQVPRRGARLQRYYRDTAMYRGHIAAQYLTIAGELARVHFGLPDTLF